MEATLTWPLVCISTLLRKGGSHPIRKPQGKTQGEDMGPGMWEIFLLGSSLVGFYV